MSIFKRIYKKIDPIPDIKPEKIMPQKVEDEAILNESDIIPDPPQGIILPQSIPLREELISPPPVNRSMPIPRKSAEQITVNVENYISELDKRMHSIKLEMDVLKRIFQ